MWLQQYDPLGNELLSALVAALPIALFLLFLTVCKMKAVYAAALTLAVSCVIAISVFDMPALQAIAAMGNGVANALWPIGFIVIMAVWLYKIAVESGKFDVIRGSIASISYDHRLQLLLIGSVLTLFLKELLDSECLLRLALHFLSLLALNRLKQQDFV